MLELYCIRHAQSTGNLKPEYIGGRSSHLDLSGLGEKQAKALGKELAAHYPKAQAIYCSPALRTRKTATLALQETNWQDCPFELADELLEQSHGALEGQLRKDVYTKGRHRRIQINPWHHAFEGGESQKDVEERLLAFLHKTCLEKAKHWGEEPYRVYLFSHAVAIKCLFRALMQSNPQESYKIHIANASITGFHYREDKGWSLEFLNAAHFCRNLEKDL